MSRRSHKLSCCAVQGSETESSCDVFDVVVVYAVANRLSSSVERRLSTLLNDEFGPRLQSIVEQRGIYSTGTVNVHVQWNIWDMAKLADEDVMWKCQITCGNAFLIITDSDSEILGKELAQELEEKEGAIVMTDQIRSSYENEVNVIDLAQALQRFCHYIKSSVGLVVPPKKAIKYVKKSRFQRLLGNVRQCFKTKKRS